MQRKKFFRLGRSAHRSPDQPSDRRKAYPTENGEIQLTEYGVSGIPVFQISRFAVRAVHEGHKTEILIDFFPESTPLRQKSFCAGVRKPVRTSPTGNCSSVFFLTDCAKFSAGSRILSRRSMVSGWKSQETPDFPRRRYAPAASAQKRSILLPWNQKSTEGFSLPRAS